MAVRRSAPRSKRRLPEPVTGQAAATPSTMPRSSEVQVGDVRTFEGARLRVLVFDDVELLYDAWWEHLDGGRGGWGLANPARAASYYRLPTRLARQTILVGKEPLTDEEQALYRPDLPLRVLRGTGWVFTQERFASLKTFARAASRQGIHAARGLESLDAPRVVIRPRGPSGGTKRGVTLEAEDGRAFKGIELLWKMHEVQAPHVRAPRTDGSGLYRLGHERGSPSFYIHGDVDAAGYLA